QSSRCAGNRARTLQQWARERPSRPKHDSLQVISRSTRRRPAGCCAECAPMPRPRSATRPSNKSTCFTPVRISTGESSFRNLSLGLQKSPFEVNPMNAQSLSPWLLRNLTRLVASLIVVFLFFQARVPDISAAERAHLAGRFHFAARLFPVNNSSQSRNVRAVHPSLKRISAWISSVGAAVAVADLDGDGLSNDVCLVDPRTDNVTIQPAPGTGERFEAFTLKPWRYGPATTAPMGCLLGDLNEDGLLDIVVYYWGRTPVAFLRKEGTPGRPTRLRAEDYLPQELVSGEERWFSNAGFFADVDGDGHPDLIIGNYFQDGARILDASATATEIMHNTKSRSFNCAPN